ncbi:hypothetical protein SKAU_G00211600 [Synaphobranchus kaupii]|uniref:SSD domain-containing protein n=1 Tax=Synaphobranchus kaupii TaxID=118154 RepID=A0A9Q1F9F8_SYNKA|nr:hypothetical protein SKAU_G00211600 [Synaphobranchus kaupii]
MVGNRAPMAAEQLAAVVRREGQAATDRKPDSNSRDVGHKPRRQNVEKERAKTVRESVIEQQEHQLEGYSQLIVEFPMAVLVTCALVLLGCSLAGILIGPLPDFSDPLLTRSSRQVEDTERTRAQDKLSATLYFEMSLFYFDNDKQRRVLHLVLYVRGYFVIPSRSRLVLRPSHLTAFSANAPVILDSIQLMNEMQLVFDHEVSGEEAARKLTSLRQGTDTVAAFAIAFRPLAGETVAFSSSGHAPDLSEFGSDTLTKKTCYEVGNLLYVDGNGEDISGTPRIRPRRMVDWDLVQDTFFCDSPGEHYAQLVFRSGNSASLWSLKAIHSMCEMEQARRWGVSLASADHQRQHTKSLPGTTSLPPSFELWEEAITASGRDPEPRATPRIEHPHQRSPGSRPWWLGRWETPRGFVTQPFMNKRGKAEDDEGLGGIGQLLDDADLVGGESFGVQLQYSGLEASRVSTAGSPPRLQPSTSPAGTGNRDWTGTGQELDRNWTGTGLELDWNWTGRSTQETGAGTEYVPSRNWTGTGLELDREVHSGNGCWNGIRSKPELDFNGMVGYTPGLDWNWTGRIHSGAGPRAAYTPGEEPSLHKEARSSMTPIQLSEAGSSTPGYWPWRTGDETQGGNASTRWSRRTTKRTTQPLILQQSTASESPKRQAIRSHAHFQDLCKQGQLEMGGAAPRRECCPSWSLGNYLAVLSNATSCLGLTAQQVSDSLSLLRQCAPYYHDGSLAPSCSKRGKLGHCASVPPQCKHSSTVYQILHYLVDKDFLGPQTIVYKVPSLKYSLLFLPVEKGDPMMKIYLDNLEGRDLTYKNTTITGMDLGIKRKLLKYYLARDSVYPVLAVVTLCLTVALYLRCSNQAFAFIDLWSLQLSQKPPATLEKRVNRVLQEVGYLILASGLTSSATFYSGYMSSITAVRCFAVYLGTASLISTLLALVWLPCSLILRERYALSVASSAPAGKPCCALSPAGFWETSSRKRCLFMMVRKLRGLKRGLADTSDLLFIKILPCGVVKFRYIWICWFAVLATGGTYITCVDPGMKLPALYSKATQLFRSSHPFERYDAEYRHQFMFERQKNGEDKPMTITLVWGVLPTDNGDHLNPNSNGSLALDPHFNMSRPEAQVWLRELCGKIQNQSFYSLLSSSPKEEVQGDNICFVEQLIHWVSIRRCSESDDVFTFCCNDIPFPYPSAVFEHCLGMMAAEKHVGGNMPNTAGPYFDSEGRIAVLVIHFKTTHLYSFNFSQTTDFYNEIEMWFNKEISGAPLGLHRGWFVSQLVLYDLQQCLSSETLVVTGFSVVLTFVVLLLTTWNIPLSIYGTAAVGGSVFVTAGLLVLLEWQLTGLEALFISAAAGLSVDFTADYCISYSLAPHSDRLGRVAHSLKRMGCPVATGAGAYFCVGVIMLPATALLFRKLGIFLLLVKCVACCFATFFFQSLCCFFGPHKNCGQILWPCTAASSQYTVKGTENMLSSCSASRPGSSDSAANGAFGCGRSHLRRSYEKGGSEGSHLCPGQQRHRQRQGRGGREPEQYELQPLACQMNDSFENSTCTSKLSNRPSVLSDEIQFHSLSPGKDLEGQSMEDHSKGSSCRHLNSCNPPALQTSSPYKENTLWPEMASTADLTRGQLLCRRCQSQSGGTRHWNVSFSSSSSMEDIIISSQPLDISHRHSLSTEGATGSPSKCQPHQHLLSSQSQSSFYGLEDSNETCLSDIEPGPSIPQASNKVEGEPEPGHLNGKRDTLLSQACPTYGSRGRGRVPCRRLTHGRRSRRCRLSLERCSSISAWRSCSSDP